MMVSFILNPDPNSLNDRQLLDELNRGCTKWTKAYEEVKNRRDPDTFDVHSAHMIVRDCLQTLRDRLNSGGLAHHPEFTQVVRAMGTLRPEESQMRGSAMTSTAVKFSDKKLVDLLLVTLDAPRNPWQNYTPR